MGGGERKKEKTVEKWESIRTEIMNNITSPIQRAIDKERYFRGMIAGNGMQNECTDE